MEKRVSPVLCAASELQTQPDPDRQNLGHWDFECAEPAEPAAVFELIQRAQPVGTWLLLALDAFLELLPINLR